MPIYGALPIILIQMFSKKVIIPYTPPTNRPTTTPIIIIKVIGITIISIIGAVYEVKFLTLKLDGIWGFRNILIFAKEYKVFVINVVIK